jgi:hypothetical protein
VNPVLYVTAQPIVVYADKALKITHIMAVIGLWAVRTSLNTGFI